MLDFDNATAGDRERLADLADDLRWLHSAYWHSYGDPAAAEKAYDLLVDYTEDPDRVRPALTMNLIDENDVTALVETVTSLGGTFTGGDLEAAADVLRGHPVASLTPARFVSLAEMAAHTGRTLRS